jgi:hypothetical protein
MREKRAGTSPAPTIFSAKNPDADLFLRFFDRADLNVSFELVVIAKFDDVARIVTNAVLPMSTSARNGYKYRSPPMTDPVIVDRISARKRKLAGISSCESSMRRTFFDSLSIHTLPE